MKETQGMKVELYGSRGSISVSRANCIGYGGNTTSLRILSDCIPKDMALATDAGTGLVPLSADVLAEGIMILNILATHYHHDHTQGLPMAGHVHHPKAKVNLFGPVEHKFGPAQLMEYLMFQPVFPVEFKAVAHRFKTTAFGHIGTQVVILHPKAGCHIVPIEVYNKQKSTTGLLPIGKRQVEISDCLVISMHKATHPEQTVSYRFEEMPTGKVFVFLTDHENTSSFPQALLQHCKGADLLIADAQYSQMVYESKTAGWGHATPEYAVSLAVAAGAKRLGITHHDPGASDSDVEQRLAEAKKAAAMDFTSGLNKDGNIFACKDYSTYAV